MTRSNAREIACHLVYEMNFNGISADEAMNLLMDPEYYPTLASETEIYAERPSGKQAEYLAGVVHGVEREREALEAFIEKNAIGWSLDRISKVAVAVMEVAMYECEHAARCPHCRCHQRGSGADEKIRGRGRGVLCQRYSREICPGGSGAMMVLGLDTSNYTTSAAAFDGVSGKNCSRLLDVREGELGLRQSDALFSHVKRLPELVSQLFAEISRDEIGAVGASTRPRAVEGSYMPCFLAGSSQAQNLATVLGVPFYAFSHQQGHIAAACWSSGRMDLMDTPHLAWHLSGGTTELLLVTPGNKNVNAEKIGGTQDISAGQLIDRTGNTFGLRFPSGKEIDRLSRESDCKERFKVKLNGLTFSFSGLENKMHAFYAATGSPADTAKYVLNCVCSCIVSVTREALKQYPGFPVVFSGGVASNAQLRQSCRDFDAVFSPPEFSTDNAMGIAVLTWLQGE